MENYYHLIKNTFLGSRKTKIAVIGKGVSIKEIDLGLLSDFFIINVNDSEKIIPGDVALFYRTDFYDQIRASGFKASSYLAPYFLKIPDNKHIEVAHKNLGQDSFEHTFDYFQEKEFYLVDFIILSAIKLIIDYQKAIGTEVEAYFLGFDFYADTVPAETDQMHDLQFTNVVLKTQESFFTNLLDNFHENYPQVMLKHVGEKNYSVISVNGFNKLLAELKHATTKKSARTNTQLYQDLLAEVKHSGKVIVVAEFTNNHIADPKRLLKMIELAKESGADMIKLQKRDVASFYTDGELDKPYKSPFGKTLGDYRKGVELSVEMFRMVDDECRRLEIPWFASVLDWNSYEFMLQFDTPLIKLPSTISNHKNYLLRVGEDFGGDLVISTGFTDSSYESFVLENFTRGRNLFLLQCTSSYPTPPEACQISVVRHYDELSSQQYPSMFSGYSSHDIGSLGCMMAVAAGAKMIEKHVKLGDLEWVHFDGVAIDLYNNKFKDFVRDVHKAEMMSGSKEKKIHDKEHHKYSVNEKAN